MQATLGTPKGHVTLGTTKGAKVVTSGKVAPSLTLEQFLQKSHQNTKPNTCVRYVEAFVGTIELCTDEKGKMGVGSKRCVNGQCTWDPYRRGLSCAERMQKFGALLDAILAAFQAIRSGATGPTSNLSPATREPLLKLLSIAEQHIKDGRKHISHVCTDAFMDQLLPISIAITTLLQKLPRINPYSLEPTVPLSDSKTPLIRGGVKGGKTSPAGKTSQAGKTTKAGRSRTGSTRRPNARKMDPDYTQTVDGTTPSANTTTAPNQPTVTTQQAANRIEALTQELRAIAQQGQGAEAAAHQTQWENDAILIRTKDLNERLKAQEEELKQLRDTSHSSAATSREKIQQLEKEIAEVKQQREQVEEQKNRAQTELDTIVSHKFVVAGTEAENLARLQAQQLQYKQMYEHMLARELATQASLETLRKAEAQMKEKLDQVQTRYQKDIETLQGEIKYQNDLGNSPASEREKKLLDKIYLMEQLIAEQKAATSETLDKAEKVMEHINIPTQESEMVREYLQQLEEIKKQDKEIAELKSKLRQLMKSVATVVDTQQQKTELATAELRHEANVAKQKQDQAETKAQNSLNAQHSLSLKLKAEVERAERNRVNATQQIAQLNFKLRQATLSQSEAQKQVQEMEIDIKNKLALEKQRIIRNAQLEKLAWKGKQDQEVATLQQRLDQRTATIREKEQALEHLQIQLAAQKNQFLEKHQEIKKQRDAMDAQQLDLDRKSQQVTLLLSQTEQKVRTFKTWEDTLKQQLDITQAQAAEFKQNAENRIQLKQNEILGMRTELQQQKDLLLACTRSREELLAQNRTLQEKMLQYQQDLTRTKSNLMKSQNQYQTYISQLQGQMQRMHQSVQECGRQLAHVSQVHHHNAQRAEEAARLKDKLVNYEQQLQQSAAALQRARQSKGIEQQQWNAMQAALQQNNITMQTMKQQISGLTAEMEVNKSQESELESHIQMLTEKYQQEIQKREATLQAERNRFEQEETKLQLQITSLSRNNQLLQGEVKSLQTGQVQLRNLLADTQVTTSQQTQRLIAQANERASTQPLLTGNSTLHPITLT